LANWNNTFLWFWNKAFSQLFTFWNGFCFQAIVYKKGSCLSSTNQTWPFQNLQFWRLQNDYWLNNIPKIRLYNKANWQSGSSTSRPKPPTWLLYKKVLGIWWFLPTILSLYKMIGLDLSPMDFAQKKIQGSSLCRKSKRGCHNIYMLYIYTYTQLYT
jgi:hypothetical protein